VLAGGAVAVVGILLWIANSRLGSNDGVVASA